MLNLSQLGKVREKPEAYIYLHFLSTFLEGISVQRDRIQEIIHSMEPLQAALATHDIAESGVEDFWRLQGSLFREIRVFFWWWHSVYLIVWIGENVRGGGHTKYLIEILGDDFSNAIMKFKDQVKEFSEVRNNLEHILERIHKGEKVLGNLLSINGKEHSFQFGDKKIDISERSLGLVNLLETAINEWLSIQSSTQ